MFFDLAPPSPLWGASVSIWAPIVIAFIALVATFISDWRQRRHNRLSVRPSLAVSITENSIALTNSGLGPARIGAVEAIVELVHQGRN